MIAINNLTYYVSGDRPIYYQANLHITPEDKLVLIGPNGAGKSTLLKLINGDLTPDGGEISKAKDCSIGFLNQDLLSFKSEKSILEVTMDAFSEVLEIQGQIDHIIKQLETDYSDKLVERLGDLQEKFDRMEGYSVQAKAEEVLEGIGFTTSDLSRPLSEFSGGWRMRVMLAKLLLNQPSLLLMDEPTNHLDLPSIEWVEKYLKSYPGAYIVVSHDRRFLDEIGEKTVEVGGQELNLYPGNYSFYLEEREIRREIQQNAYENQQQKIKQTEQFIDRFRAKSTKARQVQSRIKQLERMDMVDEVNDDQAVMHLDFKVNTPSGKLVMELEDIDKSYDKPLFHQASSIIRRHDKIALIGANGKGKSTWLRIVSGTETFDGERKPGHNVVTAFYAQHQLEALNLDNSILDELKQSGSGKTEQELRTVLGSFLFTGEDVYKKIKVLSGGEKSRVALAKTLISNANFLLLDEPTNHLDMQSENILIQALNNYEGTLIFVSHNRHFISQVANKVWYIDEKDVKEYPGTFDEYLWWYSKQDKAADDPVTDNAPKSEAPKAKESRRKPKSDQQQRALNKEIDEIENKIMLLESEKQKLEKKMAEPEVYDDSSKLEELHQKYATIKEELDRHTSSWEKLVEEKSDI